MKMNQNGTSHQDASESATSTVASAEPLKTPKASPPFDDVGGDVILRTADNVDFHLFMTILRLASPLFSDMLSLPQPIESKEDSTIETPIIPVNETSTTLDTLLRLCYPIDRPELRKQEMSLIGDVLRAALKYDITIVVKVAREAFKERLVKSEKDALTAYAIACSLELGDEAREAATACLRWPALHTTVPELDLMSGWDYYNLLDFHRRAGEAVTSLFCQSLFVNNICSGIFTSGHHCTVHAQSIAFNDGSNAWITQWWVESMDELKTAFGIAPLDTGVISLPFMASKVRPKSCFECAAKLCEGWNQTSKKMLSTIKQEVAKVELKLSWK